MKKFISVMLVAAMAVTALTGCGSNSGSSSKKDADKYYIGGIGPTTGATAIYGTAVKNGAQIAVDEINAAGGINGKQIEYRFEDDQNDAEKSVNAYNTLKDWGMQMLVGTTTTAPCIAVAGKTASDNMFQITPSASAPDVLSSGNGNVFQVCFTDPNQGIASAANGVKSITPSANFVSKFSTVRIPSIPSTPKNLGLYPIVSACFKIIEAS